MKYIIISVFVCILVCTFINFVNRESLEDIKMGSVSVAPGDTIYDVSKKMQKSLIASGSDWKISVDSEILDERASSHFVSGGSGLAVAILARNFDCKCVMLRKERRLLIVGDFKTDAAN